MTGRPEKATTPELYGRLLIYVMLGYSIGSLPHDGVAWSALHVIVLLLWLGSFAYVARRKVCR